MFHARQPHRGLFSPRAISILAAATGGLAAIFGGAGVARADIINVPADFATIQAAINAAVDGDEVLIAPGTYVTSGIILNNKAITVRGSGGASVTIIQAPTLTAIILTLSNVEQDTVLDGLTFDRGGALFDGSGALNITTSHPTLMNCIFKNADATAVHRQSGTGNMVVTNCQFLNNETAATIEGGALQIVTGTATITGCNFTGNSALRNGGAIRMAGGGTISGCTFEDNSIETQGISNEYGGAIFVDDLNAVLLIDDCEFINNSSSRTGGAIYAFRSAGFAAVTISNCQFHDNTAPTAGGGVYAHGAPVSVVDCTFTENSSSTGGGAYLINGANTTGCTFTNNVTSGGAAGRGAGLAVENSIATNCMFTGNQSTGNGGAMYALGTASILTNCNAYTNSAGVGLGGDLNSALGSTAALIDSVLCANTPDNLQVGGLLNATGVIACDRPMGPVGACCLPQGVCVITSEASCVAAMGTYQGNATACESASCPGPSCPADIAPLGGNGQVNVSDLLKVISDWGLCP